MNVNQAAAPPAASSPPVDPAGSSVPPPPGVPGPSAPPQAANKDLKDRKVKKEAVPELKANTVDEFENIITKRANDPEFHEAKSMSTSMKVRLVAGLALMVLGFAILCTAGILLPALPLTTGVILCCYILPSAWGVSTFMGALIAAPYLGYSGKQKQSDEKKIKHLDQVLEAQRNFADPKFKDLIGEFSPPYSSKQIDAFNRLFAKRKELAALEERMKVTKDEKLLLKLVQNKQKLEKEANIIKGELNV